MDDPLSLQVRPPPDERYPNNPTNPTNPLDPTNPTNPTDPNKGLDVADDPLSFQVQPPPDQLDRITRKKTYVASLGRPPEYISLIALHSTI
jgi:hypothetical protein